MDLTQIVLVLTIFGMLFTAISVATKIVTKRRNEEITDMKRDIKVLQESDNSKQLAITEIKVTLENLVQSHEKTQGMISNTTTELILAIKEMSKH